MTLPKAIEIGDLNIKEAGKKMPPDTLDALKLLVEAGKQIHNHRASLPPQAIYLLPGETAED
ncbi:unnamed protein product [marine sediment metagenome]|uniref:Uncharacterized protein n=1 Tax=marine sediment metagenome TaxID=412755 RepID=X1MCI3_9ZZZZ